jgi:hypothetical protein
MIKALTVRSRQIQHKLWGIHGSEVVWAPYSILGSPAGHCLSYYHFGVMESPYLSLSFPEMMNVGRNGPPSHLTTIIQNFFPQMVNTPSISDIVKQY